MNFRLIPVDFVVEQAKALKSYAETLPLRTLLTNWFASQNHEAEGYEAVGDIDEHINPAKLVGLNDEPDEEPIVLDSCVLGRYRNNQTKARMLVAIIHEIHRRMNIPKSESRKAKRVEDVRKDNWTWPHVMRVMIKNDIIFENTNKSTFGGMIEKILGDKVTQNYIRRSNYGDFSIKDKSDFSLNTGEKDVIIEITALFLPLIRPKNNIETAKDLTFR